MELPQPTPDQSQDLKREAEISLEGQTAEFREAVKTALTAVNLEVTAIGGQPQIDAVTAALTSVLAEFIAMQPSRNVRRLQVKHHVRDLDRLIALRCASGGLA